MENTMKLMVKSAFSTLENILKGGWAIYEHPAVREYECTATAVPEIVLSTVFFRRVDMSEFPWNRRWVYLMQELFKNFDVWYNDYSTTEDGRVTNFLKGRELPRNIIETNRVFKGIHIRPGLIGDLVEFAVPDGDNGEVKYLYVDGNLFENIKNTVKDPAYIPEEFIDSERKKDWVAYHAPLIEKMQNADISDKEIAVLNTFKDLLRKDDCDNFYFWDEIPACLKNSVKGFANAQIHNLDCNLVSDEVSDNHFIIEFIATRPGIAIGRGGIGIDAMTAYLTEIARIYWTNAKVSFSIREYDVWKIECCSDGKRYRLW